MIDARAKFERFARGEAMAVEVGEIERELGSLWQQASQTSDSAAVAGAVLWNLVVPTRGRSTLAKIKALCDELAPAVPVAPSRCASTTPPAPLSATIESNVVSQPGGGRVVYSEEITLVGPAGAEAHFGAMVRALQVPGVRTATLWMDAAMPSSLLARELLPVTRRLIVDTASCAAPWSCASSRRWPRARCPRPVADLGWLRLGSFRLLFAGLFDPPVGGAPLAARLAVDGAPPAGRRRQRVAGRGLAGAAARVAADARGGDLRRRPAFRLRSSGRRAVQAFLVPGRRRLRPERDPEHRADQRPRRVRRHARGHRSGRVQVPIAPAKTVKLDASSDAELCVAALGPRGRDPLFARCLAYAGRLWALEPGTSGSRR